MKALEKMKGVRASSEAEPLLMSFKVIKLWAIKGDWMAVREALAHIFQMAPLINSRVIILQALRAWGNDGHTLRC